MEDKQINLGRLREYFAAGDLDWKPITVSRKTGKGLAAAYITNRAIMDRLDEVCGPENWRNEYRSGPDGGVMCGLSIRIGSEWVTKWDGAENTDIEPVKGGLSSAMRRAAVQWGIGRYLYNLPQQWVPVDERGRFQHTPQIDRAFLPPHTGGDGAPVAAQQPPVPARTKPRTARPDATASDPASEPESNRLEDEAAEFFMPARRR